MLASCPLRSPGYETGSRQRQQATGRRQWWPLHAIESRQAGSEQLAAPARQQAVAVSRDAASYNTLIKKKIKFSS